MRFERNWACTHKMTRISSATHPTLLNLLSNQSLDVVLYPMQWPDMQINYLICIFIKTDENFRK